MLQGHVIGIAVEYAVEALLRTEYGALYLAALLAVGAALVLLRPLLRSVHPLWWLALVLLVLTVQA